MNRICFVASLGMLLPTTSALANEPRGAVGITLSLDDTNGAWIIGVTPGTPAARSRLQAGDQILAIDGTPVKGPADVARVIYASEPGSRIRFDIDRQGLQGPLWVVVGTPAEIAQAVRENAA